MNYFVIMFNDGAVQVSFKDEEAANSILEDVIGIIPKTSVVAIELRNGSYVVDIYNNWYFFDGESSIKIDAPKYTMGLEHHVIDFM